MDTDGRTTFVGQLAEDWRALELPANEVAMLEYVEKITLTAATMVPGDVQALRNAGWSDREVLDIALVAAYYCFRCRMADGLGVELDDDKTGSEIFAELHRRRVVPERR